MRTILATASLALLAACGGGASNNNNNNNSAAAAPAGAEDAEIAAMRGRGIAGCSAEVSRRTPPGTDVARLCGCAVDRLMAGKTLAQLRQIRGGSEQEALNACAGEQGVTLQPRGSERPAPAAPAPEGGNSTE
ncbi:MAG TPA: hypothetical protein VMS43_00895 [Allosphingosinicella sp.]|nr:hypothetical protein [Allosphingosinicella sp.]